MGTFEGELFIFHIFFPNDFEGGNRGQCDPLNWPVRGGGGAANQEGGAPFLLTNPLCIQTGSGRPANTQPL